MRMCKSQFMQFKCVEYFQEFSKNQSFANYPSFLFATGIHGLHIPDVRDATPTKTYRPYTIELKAYTTRAMVTQLKISA